MSSTDPAQLQLMVTGIREALAGARPVDPEPEVRPRPRIRRLAGAADDEATTRPAS